MEANITTHSPQSVIEVTRPKDNITFESVYFDGNKAIQRKEHHEVPRLFGEKEDGIILDKGTGFLSVDEINEHFDLTKPFLFEEYEEPDETSTKGIVEDIVRRREQLSPVRDSYQLHTLSTKAKHTRDRVLKSQDEKAVIREEVQKSQKALEQVVDTYDSEKEKKRVAKETKEHLKTFWELKESLTEDPLLSVEEKARVLYNYARTFAEDVKLFKTLYMAGLTKTKREIQMDDLISRFEGLIHYFDTGETNGALLTVMGLRHGTANQRMFEKDNGYVLEKAKQKIKHIDSHNDAKAAEIEKKKRDQETDELHKPLLEDYKEQEAMKQQTVQSGERKESAAERIKRLDDSLTKEQLVGVAAADKWLIGLGTHSKKRLPFINRIMSMSARERLFIYRMVETGHLENPNIMDLTISQTDYIPSVKTLSFKLYRVPFRLWEKMGKEGLVSHHWNMLEAAIVAVSGQPVQEMLDVLVENGIVKDQEEKKEKKESKETDLLEGIEDEELKKDAENVRKLVEERSSKLDEAIKAAEECEEALRKRDTAWIRKEHKAKVANEKTDIALKALEELMELDQKLDQAVGLIKYMTDYQKEDAKADIKGYGSYATTQALGFLGKCSNIPKLFSEDIVRTSMIAAATNTTAMVGGFQMEGLLNAVNLGTAAFTTAKGALGVCASLKGFKKTLGAMLSGDLAVSDRAFMALQYGYSLGASAVGMGLGITSMAYAQKVTQSMMTGVTDSIKGMKDKTAMTSKILSTAGLAINGADMLIQGKHAIHRGLADYRIHNLKKSGELSGDDKSYMTGIQKLDTRNKVQKATDTAFSVVTNTGNLLAVSAGPVGSLAWAGISVGLSLTNKLSDYLMKERSQKKTAEEFMQLNDITDLLDTVDESAVKEIRKDKNKMNELKTSLMNHMAAELGFVTFKSLFKHIVRKYAQFLYLNLFYDKGAAILRGSEDGHAVSLACYQLLKGMGLRIKYPDTFIEKEAEKQRRPRMGAIITKLGG